MTAMVTSAQTITGGVAWVQLERPLEAIAPGGDPQQEIGRPLECLGTEEGRRAASPVQGRETRTLERTRLAVERDLPRQAVQPDRLPPVVVTEIVEVAVRALAGAERNVDVDVERTCHAAGR